MMGLSCLVLCSLKGRIASMTAIHDQLRARGIADDATVELKSSFYKHRTRRELNLRPLSARCELALGRLYEREGDQLAATAKFGTARTMMEEMGMTGWLTSFERAQPSSA
jgi:hypothetical protein